MPYPYEPLDATSLFEVIFTTDGDAFLTRSEIFSGSFPNALFAIKSVDIINIDKLFFIIFI